MRLIIVGTGSMARHHAKHFAQIRGVKIVGCVDVFPELATAFAKDFDIPRTFTTVEDAIAWGKFDSAANVTTDLAHYPTTMALITAGKHVLCEKPLATNYLHALEMTEAAEKAGLVGMVNLSYRNVPEIYKMHEMVTSGVIGDVKHVEASYLQSWLTGTHWGDWKTESRWLWRLSESHGSKGVIGDVGIHILDFASFGAGTDVTRLFGRLKTFHKAPDDKIGEYTLDANDSFAGTLEFENGAIGVIHASRFATGYANTLRVRVFGDKGGLEIQNGSDGTWLRVCKGVKDINSQTWRPVTAKPVPMNYKRFVDAVKAGHTMEPSFRRAADLQRILDASFETEKLRSELAVAG